LKKRIYLGEGEGKAELEQAWSDVFQCHISEENERRLLALPKGEIAYIGQKNGDVVYWVALGKSKKICKQAWVDFWPMVDDCIVTWDLIEK
jgi:hypothetical protein